MQQIEAALEAGRSRVIVLADAAYERETAWCERLAHGLTYAVGVQSGEGLASPWTTPPHLAREAGHARG